MATTQVTRPPSDEPTGRVLRWPARTLTPVQGRVAISIVTAGAFVFYLVHSLLEQARFLTTGYDLGIFDQAVRAYAHFKTPLVPLKGSGYNIYGDHFHPIIAVIAPLYWVWDDPRSLLLAQAALIAASIPVVYRFTRRRAGEGLSLLIAAAYAFGWPVQGLIDFDFHEVAFATPLMALAIDALDRRDDRRLVLWCALLLLVREDMGLLVAILGVLRFLLGRRSGRPRPNPRLVLGLIAGGIAVYVVTTSLIIPQFAPAGFAYGKQFSQLGPSVPAAVLNIVTQPWHAVAVFFTPVVKLKTLAWMLLPLALLPLRSPYALLALPIFAERFFNSRHYLWTTTFHYNALPWLILVMAMVDGAQRLGLFRAERRAEIARWVLAVVLAAFPVLLCVIGMKHHVVPVTHLRPGYANQPPTWEHDARAATAQIPADVCVAADNHIGPQLTRRDWVTVAQADTPDPDFYVIDMVAPDTGGNPPAPKPVEVLFQAHAAGYKIVFRSGSFLVLRAPDYTGPSAQCRPLGPGKPESARSPLSTLLGPAGR